MKVLDTKELLYSVYVKYYNNVLLKKIHKYFLIC